MGGPAHRGRGAGAVGVVCFLTKGRRVNTDNHVRVAGPGIRQSMSSLHTWAGLLLGWVLYAMFLTGTVSYFKDELSQWMRPELPRLSQIPDQAVVAQRVADELGNIAAGTSQWSIRLPDERNNSAYAFWRTTPRNPGQRGFGEGNFDPATGQTSHLARHAGRRVLLPIPLPVPLHAGGVGQMASGRSRDVHARGHC